MACTIDVDALAAMSGWTPKDYRNGLERGDITPRAAKIGGRYAFSLADTIDASLARPIVHRAVPNAEAFPHVRSVVNRLFQLRRSGDDAKAAALMTAGEGRFLNVMFRGAVLHDMHIMDRPDLSFDLPNGSHVAWKFDDGAALTIPLHQRFIRIVEKAHELRIDLHDFEHGDFQ